MLHAVTIAIMQPYFFPYLGYLQLINAVDRFVLLDDVNYGNNRWVASNAIMTGRIILPLKGRSQNQRICDMEILGDYSFVDKIVQAYSRAPYFQDALGLAARPACPMLVDYLHMSLECICRYLGVQTPIVRASVEHPFIGLKSQARIIDICVKEGATQYINPEGGQSLYD